MARRPRGSTSRHHHPQIISRQGHDHHRRSLAVWEVVWADRKVANCYAGLPARRLIKGQVVRRPITVVGAVVTTRTRNRATVGTICRRFVVADRRVARRRPPSTRLHGQLVRAWLLIAALVGRLARIVHGNEICQRNNCTIHAWFNHASERISKCDNRSISKTSVHCCRLADVRHTTQKARETAYSRGNCGYPRSLGTMRVHKIDISACFGLCNAINIFYHSYTAMKEH